MCVVGAQSSYLGRGSVAAAFTAAGPVRSGLALLALVGLPAVAALFTAASARLALRRGPRWPARFFWLPMLAVAALTTKVPGRFGGAPVARRGGGGVPRDAGGALARHAEVGGGAPVPGRATGERTPWPGPPPRGRPRGRRTGAGGCGPVRPDRGGVRAGRGTRRAGEPPAGRPGGFGERLAARFAARAPEPVVIGAVRSRRGRPASGARGATHADPRRPGRCAGDGPRWSSGLNGAAAARPRPTGPARFRLVRRLGSGGFGRVWLAHDARLGHTVALKAAHVRDAETEERIRREAHALATVRHPHCVQIHDLVPADSDPGLAELDGMVIVMEYVRGESLGELVRTRGTLDDVAAARVWSSIAGALDAAHGHGVLHRDVKPGNIVLDVDGQAHLIDFGIARKTGDATLTATGFVLGTPDFLPPEVAAGGRATPSADSWQLAATIGYALCGQPPRGDHADAVSGLRAAALGGPPTHLPRRSAHLTLLRAALHDDPARRPPLRAVHRALDDWLRSVGARPDGPVTAGPADR